MACTATINSITPQATPDGTGTGMVLQVQVTFADSSSTFNVVKSYQFAKNVGIVAAKAAIQADLDTYKTLIAATANLQQYVGTVLT